MNKHGTAPNEFMHESMQKDAVQYDLPAEEIIQALADDNKELQTEAEKPIQIQVFRICSECNEEFEVEGSKIVPEFIKGVACGYVTTFMRCPHCKKRNDIWIRVKALK